MNFAEVILPNTEIYKYMSLFIVINALKEMDGADMHHFYSGENNTRLNFSVCSKELTHIRMTYVLRLWHNRIDLQGFLHQFDNQDHFKNFRKQNLMKRLL